MRVRIWDTSTRGYVTFLTAEDIRNHKEYDNHKILSFSMKRDGLVIGKTDPGRALEIFLEAPRKKTE